MLGTITAAVIPLRDNIPSERTPIVTYSLLAVNIAVFLWQFTTGGGPGDVVVHVQGQWVRLTGFQETVWTFGVRPAELMTGVQLEPATPVSDWITPITSMFMHGGWLHLGGNMLYLWIFADNVEDAMGPGRFAAFYVIAGLVGALAQVLLHPQSGVPMVGASGAIAGVLGGYLLLYPRAKVLTLLPIFVFITFVEVSAFFFLGLWILLQVVSAPIGGGTAWFAHIGGFVAGLALVKLFARPRRADRRWPVR